jgi:aspartyl protease family protein
VLRRLFLLSAAALVAAPTLAQPGAVAATGVMGSRALLLIDGQSQMLAVGETARGVKLLAVQGDQVRVLVRGQEQVLRVGAAPASVGAPPRGPDSGVIVLPMGSGGHFYANGSINGRPVRFMVDTGATTVALGAEEAQRLGIDYQRGERGSAITAGGTVPAWRVQLRSVRIGDVDVAAVEATVVPAAMPVVLLGNSFLGRFRMQRDGDTMRLERR